MGYSHYFVLDHNHPSWAEGFGRLCLDATAIQHAAEALGVFVGGATGGGPLDGMAPYRSDAPIANEGLVDLQGLSPVGGDDADHAHEALSLPGSVGGGHSWVGTSRGRVLGGTWWDCCKTERKPYDLVVTSILLRAQMLIPEAVAIASDGEWEHEWIGGRLAWSGRRDPQWTTGTSPRRLVATVFDEPSLVDPRCPSPLRRRGVPSLRQRA